MTPIAALQLAMYLGVLLALAVPLGHYMASVYQGQSTVLTPCLRSVESGIYRLCGIDPRQESGWRDYAAAALAVNFAGFLVVYLLQRMQGHLPLNPQHLPAVGADSAFNTAVSFATNTNWQGYAGESTMTYATQMLGLGVQNFLSAATGMAVLAAVIRGFARREASHLGNFWVDFLRSNLYILLPLSLLLAIFLVSQGVVQSFSAYRSVPLLEHTGPSVTQVLPLGPAASQIAIKQLGTNGGGFFNANSAHPFENPTPLANFLELLSILLIPAALCHSFGRMVGDRRQGWVLLGAMLVIFVPLLIGTVLAEQAGNPLLNAQGVDQHASLAQAGGNMEGKEQRFGIADSALWAAATTAASNGSVNAMHDSFTPLGGMMPLFLMQLGEVVFGGVGSGLYGMLAFAIIAVFIAGLMVGRTPEYLGKKIGAYEMKMASLMVLLPCVISLAGTAIAVRVPAGTAGIANPGAHGFSEILYAFSSAGNNNGSAFAGLGANTPFYNFALGVAMWLARYWLLIPVLAMAGSLAGKKSMAASAGTLPTHDLTFVIVLVSTVLLVGALNFVPALALGPVAEHLQLWGGVVP
jgi:potassium-transporting ATPase potassium-binding subunit